MDTVSDIALMASTWIIPVLVGLTLHEIAHGYVAWALGDPTARKSGRLSLNPFRHLDRIGTIAIPLLLFAVSSPVLIGYARPIPVAYHRLPVPRRDIALVAAAGPAANLLLAAIAVLSYHAIHIVPDAAQWWAGQNIIHSIYVNLVFAVVNLLPIPPLDGGRILLGLISPDWSFQLARYDWVGLLLVAVLFLVVPLVGLLFGVEITFLQEAISGAVDTLFLALVHLFGLG